MKANFFWKGVLTGILVSFFVYFMVLFLYPEYSIFFGIVDGVSVCFVMWLPKPYRSIRVLRWFDWFVVFWPPTVVCFISNLSAISIYNQIAIFFSLSIFMICGFLLSRPVALAIQRVFDGFIKNLINKLK